MILWLALGSPTAAAIVEDDTPGHHAPEAGLHA